MFVYRTSEMVKENPVILYKYEKTRSSKLAAAFLEGLSGILESDAFSGYKTLDHAENDIQAAFCWAHARRDFADVAILTFSFLQRFKMSNIISFSGSICQQGTEQRRGRRKT